MSECEYCHEGLCVLEEGECGFQDREERFCKARPKDLINICIDCGKSEDECECWI